MSMSRIGPKGQVVLPKVVRNALGVTTGDRVYFALEGDKVVITPVRARMAADLRGILGVEGPIDLKEARRVYREDLVRKLMEDEADARSGPR